MNHDTRLRRSSVLATAGLAALFCTSLHAQNTVNANLQGDATLTTPGGWVFPAAPPGNPATPSTYFKLRSLLGKALFWDEQVSTSNTMACGTCHIPEAGGIDPRRAGVTTNALGQVILGSFGVIPQSEVGGTLDYGFTAPPSNQETRLVTEIHVPTMIGAYVFREQFWDLRAGPVFTNETTAGIPFGGVVFPDWAALENQAVGPPTSPVEMGHQNLLWPGGFIQNKLNQEAPLALIVPGSLPSSIPSSWLTTTYFKLFDTVFAMDPNPLIAASQGVTRERFAMALASYMRTLVPDQAPIDTNSMTALQMQGFDIFVNSGCGVCHSVSGFPQLVNTGGPIGTLVDRWDNSFSDGAPHNIFFTDPSRDVGPLKTPTLRNVGLRTRFFHDGRGRVIAGVPNNSIPDIVDFYDLDQDPASGGPGGPFELRGAGPNLTPLERRAVIAFLRDALTDKRVATASFPFDRPKLYTEANPFGANLTNPATGNAFWTPVTLADVPPLVEKVGGPSWWKVGVGSAGGGVGGPIIPPGSKAALFMDVADTAAGPLWLPSPVHLISIPTTAEGFATAHVPVALTASMIGSTFFLQWGVFDSAGNVGWSESSKHTVF